MPLSLVTRVKNSFSAWMPPADAPRPTTRKSSSPDEVFLFSETSEGSCFEVSSPITHLNFSWTTVLLMAKVCGSLFRLQKASTLAQALKSKFSLILAACIAVAACEARPLLQRQRVFKISYRDPPYRIPSNRKHMVLHYRPAQE